MALAARITLTSKLTGQRDHADDGGAKFDVPAGAASRVVAASFVHRRYTEKMKSDKRT